ncbi:MAG: DUF4920 domain-containing protein [Deferribacterales bacterium]
MKKYLIILALILASVTAYAKPIFLGEPLKLNSTTKISEINAHPEKYLGKRVQVQGMVIDVCAARGCWIDIASDEAFKKMEVKVIDGVIVFPMEARGRTAKVEGIVEELDFDLEETIEYYEHQAYEKGVKFDPSTVKEPMKLYRVQGLGAVIE